MRAMIPTFEKTIQSELGNHLLICSGEKKNLKQYQTAFRSIDTYFIRFRKQLVGVLRNLSLANFILLNIIYYTVKSQTV